MSTIQKPIPSVADAEKTLRLARLEEHKQTIRDGLTSNDSEKLATGCSRFLSIYRGKPKKSKK